MQWHCNNLIIVSGASGSGKSFFLQKLKQGNNSDFMVSIFEEINAPSQGLVKIASIKKFLSSRRGNARDSKKSLSSRRGNARDSKKCLSSRRRNARDSKKSCKTTFIHYDITGTRQALKRDCLLEIMNKSDNITVIILYTPYRYWRERMLKRQESNLSSKLPKKVRLILELRFNSLMGRLRYRNAYADWQNFLIESNVHKILFVDSYLEQIFECLPSDFSAFPFHSFFKKNN